MKNKSSVKAKYLLQQAVLHYSAVNILRYKSDSPYRLFTMVYLCHLVVELVIKAIISNKTGSFTKTHNLEALVSLLNLSEDENLESEELKHFNEDIKDFNHFYYLRYPQEESDINIWDKVGGIGTADFDRMIKILNFLREIMPDDLAEIFENEWNKLPHSTN